MAFELMMEGVPVPIGTVAQRLDRRPPAYLGISLPLPYQPSTQSTCLRMRKSPVAPLLSQLLFQLLDAKLSDPGP